MNWERDGLCITLKSSEAFRQLVLTAHYWIGPVLASRAAPSVLLASRALGMRVCSLVLAITTATALRLPGGCRPAGRVARRVPGWAAAMCTDSSQSLPQIPEKVEAREAGAVCCVDT